MVYSSVPSSLILSSLLGMVMLWATDFFPLWKKVSGVQILLAIRLLRGRIFIGPWNFNLSSFQLWRKKTSIVYSCGAEVKNELHPTWCFSFPINESEPGLCWIKYWTHWSAAMFCKLRFLTGDFTCSFEMQDTQRFLSLRKASSRWGCSSQRRCVP